MEFDSPEVEVAKEFPGLYAAERAGKTMNESLDYDEDDKKRKKEKKDKNKDKGYSTLAGESSHDEDEVFDINSHGKAKKIKGFKLSSKKKDKDKERKHDKEKDRELKKAEKEKARELKKLEKEKDQELKKSEKERKGSDKEKEKEKRVVEKEKEKPEEHVPIRRPFSGDHLHLNRDHIPFSPTAKVTQRLSSAPLASLDRQDSKEKTSALNAFLNAPAPKILLSKKKDKDKERDSGKKEKDHKKDKDYGMGKVKLKLKRSKNSLEESPSGEVVVACHQFPEDAENIAKEIKRYEVLLETTHAQLKTGKKVSKKQEEQLWELQRTLTQLKRKLRSVNALSSASSSFHHSDLPDGPNVSDIFPTVGAMASKHAEAKHESETGSRRHSKASNLEEEIQLDLSLQEIRGDEDEDDKGDAVTTQQKVVIPKLPSPPRSDRNVVNQNGETESQHLPTGKEAGRKSSVEEGHVRKVSSARKSLDLSDIPVGSSFVVVSNSSDFSKFSDQDEADEVADVKHAELESPTVELEKVEVEVQVHKSYQRSLTPEIFADSLDQEPDSTTIEHVVDDANKMIGSMHEELEAAALVFGCGNGPFELIEAEPKKVMSKSEPTLGDDHKDRIDFNAETEEDDNSDDFDLLMDDQPIPDPFSLLVFETEEYLTIENEALAVFNEQLKDDILKEESKIDALMDRLSEMKASGIDIDALDDEDNLEHYDVDELITIWQRAKQDNNSLNENVNGLRVLVALNKLDHFRLETRVKFLENKTAVSPITTTTPLQPDAGN